MELLVVLAVIVSIMGIVLTSQSAFNKTLLLANTAYDIALTLRFTENLGTGTLAAGPISNAPRGIHLDRAVPNSFILFADTDPILSSACTTATPDCKPGDGVYTADKDQRTQAYALGNGMSISDFCALAESGSWSCANSPDQTLSSLDITFARPNPDARIRANGNTSAVYTSACIALKPLEQVADRRYVTIKPSGSITANAQPCTPTP